IKVVLTGLLVGLITILLLLDALVFTENFTFRIIKMGVLLIFLYFGFLLINSVLQEIKRRQEIEKMSFKLEKAYQELKKLDVAKTEFISIASHQLRTPLTVIKGYISMMLEGSYGKMPIKTKGPMKNVYKSNERLIKLVNDMLTVSKVEMGKIEVEFKKTDIKNVISDLVNDLKLKVKEKNLYLNFEKPKKQLPKILIDADKIGQVILNILDNAIRYTDEGGITLKIEKLKTKVRIIISDTGSGMTKKEISRLFKSFTRGVAGTKLWTEGAGLGLYIAKKYIDLHKGKIWVESKGEGKGSTFFIELLIK
ncbi:MAG: HAMP domain-containing histidine kinase, partial [Candidatus Pacebacteria bacterium]|nr:HAMP domain-containing histidine kinase [Candidatus Paceibacterota bacterium]